ncbi:MAG: hypothetical protein NT099_00295 [Candidatus Saganbacteria bacterium]|nr:hypothetical protein [Candidatus Saganbacteria bacterium]
MEKAQILSRLGLLEHYPAPLSKRGKELVTAAKQAFLARRDIPGDALAALETLPRWMFESYFQGMPEAEIAAFFDVRLGISPHLRRFLSAREAVDALNAKMVNVTKGCSTQCDFCYAFSGGNVLYTPWVWIEEIAEKLAPYDHDINFDADALRDYYDPLFDKDFGDVARKIRFSRISTSGFEEGSIGERAALKIAEDRSEHCIVVNFSLMSRWSRALGKERYTQAMANVFRILNPDKVYLFYDGENNRETWDVFYAAGGEISRASPSRPHREGRALHMPEGATHFQGSSVVNRNVFLMEPDAELAFVSRQGKTHARTVARKYGEGFLPEINIEHLYTIMLLEPAAAYMAPLVERSA